MFSKELAGLCRRGSKGGARRRENFGELSIEKVGFASVIGDPLAPIEKISDSRALFTLGLYVTPESLTCMAVVVPALGDKVFNVVIMGLPAEFLN